MNTEKSAHRFEAVLDSRKRKVIGLWQRNGIFYAQLRIDLGHGRSGPRRFPLAVSDLTAARAELDRLRTARRDCKLRRPGHQTKLAGFAAEYLASSALAQKKPATQRSERQAIARWIAHAGAVPIDKIDAPTIHRFREDRLAAGLAARTVNLDVIALRHVLRFACDRALIADLPKVRALKERPAPKRPLLTKQEFLSLLEAATPATTKNWRQFRFYLRFLALTGGREKESLGVRRVDLDLEGGRVTIGAGGNRQERPRTHGGLLSGAECLAQRVARRAAA